MAETEAKGHVLEKNMAIPVLSNYFVAIKAFSITSLTSIAYIEALKLEKYVN